MIVLVGILRASSLHGHARITECEWVVNPKWGHVAQSPMSLRSPDSIDIPDGVKFNFKLFAQFLEAVKAG